MEPQQLRISLDLVGDKEGFARAFYRRLFADFPDVATLFQRTEWNRQYSSLMATLAYVVAGVERGDNLTPALRDLGAKHHRHGATPEHYPLVGATLMATFHAVLGETFTKEMEDSWIQAFEIISNQMLIGAQKR
jgi:methyl-accepting chemotaxis protein